MTTESDNLARTREFLAMTWELMQTLRIRRLEDAEVLQLKQIKELSNILNKMIPLQMKLEKFNKKPIVIDAEIDKLLIEDFIARKISEKHDDDRLNSAQ